MKTHTTALRRAMTPLMLAGLALSSGLLPAQKAGKGQKNGSKAAVAASQPAAPPAFTEAGRVPAQSGKIDAPLYAVFGEVTVPGIPPSIDKDGKIYVRSYAPGDAQMKGKTQPSIPGPTYVFQPGDLLRLRFHNYLNRSQDPALNAFQNNPQVAGPAASDDTDEHVSHEISIPNDSNVTNLHVHGLHVDPKQDDVTLLVLPEDNDPGSLTPALQRFVPTINRWWTRTYQYKLPADHLPGTYWYHSHKHGSTSSQVENGMAGTLIIRPKNEQDDIVPGLWNDNPAKTHDRVMMVQELSNYSTGAMLKKQGRGKGQGQAPNLNAPVVTINGEYQPSLTLAPGQIERWRFIVAGANHTTSSYIWVGSIRPQLTQQNLTDLQSINSATQKPALTTNAPILCTPLPGQIKLIAADGITMWQPRDVTPQNPAFGSAGNRLDLLVQADPTFQTDGNIYRIYQNYPVPALSDMAVFYPDLFDGSNPKAGTSADIAARYTALTAKAQFANAAGTTTSAAASNIPTDPFALGTNYQGFTQTWVNVDDQGKPIPNSAAALPVAPLLRGRRTSYNGVEIDPGFPQKFGGIGWQSLPDAPGGAGVSASILVNLDISGKPDGPTDFPKYLDARLSALSPAGTGSMLQRVDPISQQLEQGIPSYVSPISDADIAGAQVAVFDRGQFTFSYVDKATQKQIDVRQFSINGLQFNVDDWIGNPASADSIRAPLSNVEPSLGVYSPAAAANAWTHQTSAGILVTNPGYFTPIKQAPNATDKNGKPVTAFNYDYPAAVPLSYTAITGLDKPHTPVSTTAEEWLLVNNSDLFHPFHIHINPFFVTEIGQLNYDGKSWGLKTITLDQKADPKVPFSWVVGNWWDVITIPPHGYVRFRMWINVPTQNPVDHGNPDSDLVVHDNANLYGSWVFHCHILRHEDRGMMLMVNTQPKGFDLDGAWTQDGGSSSYQIDDNHGGLSIQAPAGTASPNNFTRGTFNRGIGNALFSQPFLGSMTDASGTISAFCVVNDPKQPTPSQMLLSNGHFLSRSGSPGAAQAAATKLDLSGDWVDVENRIVTITQRPDKKTAGAANLVFTPKTNVWWSNGTGTWVPSPASYTGTQVVTNNAGQNQLLTFCISLDLKTLVFSNGITWTRKGN